MTAFRILRAALLCLLFVAPAQAATTLLPNGKQCFTTASGAVVSGSMNLFVPNTTTPKASWQDSAQVTLNSQPLQLDANGCAIIYGVGIYRQQLYDGPVVAGATSGNLIWDQLTTDTSAFNSVFWAGLSAGTPNVITIVDPGFNGTDGTVINFTAIATNTSSVTINPSGFGAIQVKKGTTAGPVSLIGGEIIQNNQISVIYSASANSFFLLNPPIQSASGTTAPLCGASGLVVTNGASPSSIASITARQAVMQSTGGLTITRSTVSQIVNITLGTVTSTAGGMDGEVPGTSSWIDLFLIDNGASTSAVGTAGAGNGLTPNLPSGYIYACYVGAMRVDGSGNLLRTLQKGLDTQFTIISGTNTAAMPSISTGAVGNAAAGTYVAQSISAFSPPTATRIIVAFASGGTSEAYIIAPNSQYGSITSTTNPPPCGNRVASGTTANANMCSLLLESTSIYYANGGTGSDVLFAFGWRDSVNAN